MHACICIYGYSCRASEIRFKDGHAQHGARAEFLITVLRGGGGQRHMCVHAELLTCAATRFDDNSLVIIAIAIIAIAIIAIANKILGPYYDKQALITIHLVQYTCNHCADYTLNYYM